MKVARGKPAAGYRYRSFGTFRLFLAGLVMLQHFSADLAPLPLATALGPYAVGNMAVLAFFALSGFVISEAADCIYRDRAGAFMVNRLLRIVPHFLIAVTLSMGAHEFFRIAGGVRLWRSQPSFPDDAFALSNVLSNFVGIVPLSDRMIDYNFLDIAWAVRVEMAFYLVMCACIVAARRFPGPRGLAFAAGAAALVLTPLAILAIQGRGIAMLAFLPYFVFGAALYFATVGRRGAKLVTMISIPAMVWQCLSPQAVVGVAHAAPPSLIGHLVVVILLLGLMTVLASANITRFRHADQMFGNLTYPLYLYHEAVLIVFLTLTAGYSYTAFAGGLVASVMIAGMLTAMIDPLVTRYRDRVRGRSLRNAGTSISDLLGSGRTLPTG